MKNPKSKKMQNSKTAFKREFSAGGVVYKKKDNKLEWLIGKHSGYHKWVLPKGLIEKGEKGFETALRETKEEMGVKVRLVSEKPIHRVQYVYWADFKKPVDSSNYQQSDEINQRRRVARYQESGGKKTRVFKVVSFYLMEYESGDSEDHDWEMEEAGWYTYKEAKEKLAFQGEKETLKKANDRISGNRI